MPSIRHMEQVDPNEFARLLNTHVSEHRLTKFLASNPRLLYIGVSAALAEMFATCSGNFH
jgi:hypothetical protein